ncbi:MAG: hypothetical protein DMG06_18325 [Acidobacteria bacterium]|nr:MAG: hypothetical protein DMG06_18325 [Acidobacteriota bacterium]
MPSQIKLRICLLFLILLEFSYQPATRSVSFGQQAETEKSGQPPISPDPVLRAVLEKAGAYAREYRKLCRELVAEEKLIQKEYDKKGKLKNQRLFTSDYLVVTLPSDPESPVEFRDIISIDGKPIARKNQGLLELFRKKSANAFEEAERVAQESTKHNLGRKRYSNMVNFGLNFILPEFHDRIVYQLIESGPALHDKTLLLEFREATDETALRAETPFGQKPIPSKGRIWLTQPDAKVLKIDFTFKQDAEFYPIAGRYLSEYQPGPDNLLLPSRFEEYFYDLKVPDRVIFESVASYSNFRRFSTEVRIVPEDPTPDLPK